MTINETFRYLHIGLPQDILQEKLYGNLSEAVRLIDLRLQDPKVPQPLRQCMIVQREMMQRLPREYPYTVDEALALVREHIPDFTREELQRHMDRGEAGWIYLNGEKHLFNRFYQTLVKTDEAFAKRAGEVDCVNSTARVEMLNNCMQEMRAHGSMARRLRIRASVRIKDECFVPGMTVRAHLPIPAACEQQSDIVIERVEPSCGQIAPENAEMRTVCWETTLAENQPFVVEYSYTHRAAYHDTYAMNGDAVQQNFDTQEEAPHILFTPYIRQLVSDLTAGVNDPLEKARRFYDFITQTMHYTFMPEYFVLENIAENCARNSCGDCGVFALLFITLCRCAGIPAQWQSGLDAEPDSVGAHDWARFYIEPYGWLYADPSFGVSANRQGNEERRRFYFGNLDPYRMVANRRFQAEFTVPKKHWRADPYDNQTGEIETEERGLGYDEYERWQEMLLCEPV